MAIPSATQYHGTIVVAIVLAIAGLAIAASLSQRGVGPYAAQVRDVMPADPGFTISIDVTNQGTSAGRAKCQVVALDADGRRLRTANAISDRLEGGRTGSLDFTIPGLDTEPADVTVSCS